MSWRVFLTNSAQPDVDALTDADRAALTEDLFAWVEPGPPRSGRRIVAGAELFEHRLPSGIVLTYFVNEKVPYVAVIRARKP